MQNVKKNVRNAVLLTYILLLCFSLFTSEVTSKTKPESLPCFQSPNSCTSMVLSNWNSIFYFLYNRFFQQVVACTVVLSIKSSNIWTHPKPVLHSILSVCQIVPVELSCFCSKAEGKRLDCLLLRWLHLYILLRDPKSTCYRKSCELSFGVKYLANVCMLRQRMKVGGVRLVMHFN